MIFILQGKNKIIAKTYNKKYPDMKKYIFINQFDNSEKSNIDYESYNLEKINKISFYDIDSTVE